MEKGVIVLVLVIIGISILASCGEESVYEVHFINGQTLEVTCSRGRVTPYGDFVCDTTVYNYVSYSRKLE